MERNWRTPVASAALSLQTKRALTDHEAELALTDCASIGNSSVGDNVSHAFKIINRSLKVRMGGGRRAYYHCHGDARRCHRCHHHHHAQMMNLEVRSTVVPNSEDNQLVHAVVNLVNDDIAKMNGTKLQPAELDVYKQAVQLIGQVCKQGVG